MKFAHIGAAVVEEMRPDGGLHDGVESQFQVSDSEWGKLSKRRVLCEETAKLVENLGSWRCWQIIRGEIFPKAECEGKCQKWKSRRSYKKTAILWKLCVDRK